MSSALLSHLQRQFEYESRRPPSNQLTASPSRVQHNHPTPQVPPADQTQQLLGSQLPWEPLQAPPQHRPPQDVGDIDPFEPDNSYVEHSGPRDRSPDTVKPYMTASVESDDLEAAAGSSQFLPGSDLF